MTLATLILTAIAATGAIAAYLEQRRRREPAGLTGRAVLVSTRGDTAIEGVVHQDMPDRLTLRDAVVITVGRDAKAPAAGLVHIERIHIDIVQELPPALTRSEG